MTKKEIRIDEIVKISDAIHVLNASFQSKIYFRGSIGLGTIYKEDDIIIGPAIDGAAEDHQQSNWIGVSLTPSASVM